MKRILASTVTLFMGLGVGLFWTDTDHEQERRASASRAEVLGVELRKLQDTVKALTQERDDAKANVAKLEESAKSLTARSAHAGAQASESTPKQSAAAGGADSKNLSKLLTDLMQAPEMKTMMKAQQSAQIDMIYGGLFSRLHLKDDEKQEFKAMIADRVQAEQEYALRLLEKGLSEDQRKAALKAFKDAENANSLKIKTFLNHEQDYQTFQSWEESKADRMALSLGYAAFSAAGEPLTSTQEDQLVKAMTFARSRRTDVPDLTKAENLTALSADENAMAKMTSALNAQAQEVAAAAAAFLTPKQLEALKTFQEQQRAMQATGIKMSASLFKPEK